MIVNQGEVREIGIEIISQMNQNFVIDAADFKITKNDETVVENGIATIEGHKVLTLFSAKDLGKFYCQFTYRIGPEILKAKISIEVR